jgi:hypothetical protein
MEKMAVSEEIQDMAKSMETFVDNDKSTTCEVCVNFTKVTFNPTTETQRNLIERLHAQSWNGFGGLESNLPDDLTQMASVLRSYTKHETAVTFYIWRKS